MKVCILISMAALLLLPLPVYSITANHLVISEIQLTGGSGRSTDEFVELYNPTEQIIALDGWQLIKRTAAGGEYVLVSDFTGQRVSPYSYFLITHPSGYLGSVERDWPYDTTNSISDNNTVYIVDGQGAVIDLVGFGSAGEFEGEAAGNPGAKRSLERKAFGDATAALMGDGGLYHFSGNSEDSDNNAADFVIRQVSEPQNSQFNPEYPNTSPENPPPSADEPESTDSPSSDNHPTYSDAIIITELFPNPSGSDEGEFIELYNYGDRAVNLVGWQLGDSSRRRFTWSVNAIIKAHEYLVVAKTDSGISLNNSGDSVMLYQPNGDVLDYISYDHSREAQSYSLVDDEWVWTDSITPGTANQFSIANELPEAVFSVSNESAKVGQTIVFDAGQSSDPDGDKLTFHWNFGKKEVAEGKKIKYAFAAAGKFTVTLTVTDEKGGEAEESIDIVITDYDYSDTLLISELLPSCSPSDRVCEFIELFNLEKRDIDLTGWKLTDEKSNYVFNNVIIEAGGYISLDREESKIVLNNSGDSIFLVDPKGVIINGVAYTKADKDTSFSRDGTTGHWHWTKELTPGEENIIREEDPEKITAETSGNESAEVGEVIEVAISEITEEYLGTVLTVTGEVEKSNSRGIYIMDDLGTVLRVYIQSKTGIVRPKLVEGDVITVTGVLDKTKAGLRLLPRTSEDLVFNSPPAAVTDEGKVLGAATDIEQTVIPFEHDNRSGTISWYLLFTIGGIASILLGLTIRHLVKIKQESASGKSGI